jgi:hypothetical protein
MMNHFALTASVLMLAAISGQVLGKSVVPQDRGALNAANAFDRTVAAPVSAANAYRYHGGPKSND